jgi:hypothetical protein
MWSTCIVKKQIVPYWRIYVKPNKKKHMNMKIMAITLVQHLWLANNQVRIDQVQFLSIEYLWKQLDHKKNFFKE